MANVSMEPASVTQDGPVRIVLSVLRHNVLSSILKVAPFCKQMHPGSFLVLFCSQRIEGLFGVLMSLWCLVPGDYYQLDSQIPLYFD